MISYHLVLRTGYYVLVINESFFEREVIIWSIEPDVLSQSLKKVSSKEKLSFVINRIYCRYCVSINRESFFGSDFKVCLYVPVEYTSLVIPEDFFENEDKIWSFEPNIGIQSSKKEPSQPDYPYLFVKNSYL